VTTLQRVRIGHADAERHEAFLRFVSRVFSLDGVEIRGAQLGAVGSLPEGRGKVTRAA